MCPPLIYANSPTRLCLTGRCDNSCTRFCVDCWFEGEYHPGTALSVLAEPIEAACETANRLGLWFSGLAYETESKPTNSTTFDPHHYQPPRFAVPDKLLRTFPGSGFKVPAHRFYWTHVADTVPGRLQTGISGRGGCATTRFLSAVLPTAARTRKFPALTTSGSTLQGWRRFMSTDRFNDFDGAFTVDGRSMGHRSARLVVPPS